MIIKKETGTSFLIKSNKTKVKVSLEKEFLSVDIMKEENVSRIDKPGEYEIDGVNVVALEVAEDKYSARSNIIKVLLDEINVVCISSDGIKLDKDLKEELSNTNILVVSGEAQAKAKSKVSEINPDVVIFTDMLTPKEKTVNEFIKKNLGRDEFIKGKKFKFMKSSFSSDEDTSLDVYLFE